MSSRVQVLSVNRVDATAAASAGADKEHELSFFDAMQIARVPTQRLFFFDGPDLPPFPSIVSALRTSLADTLAVFIPLTGELAFRPSSGTVVLDCSSSCGVRFVEAEYLGGAEDMRRIARQDEHDTEAFMQLVPELEVAQLPAPVLAVQVTRGHGGAVAVGVSMHHAVADGQGMWQFIRAWSTATRRGADEPTAAALVPPTFDRAATLQHPMASELYRMVLRLWAPALPLLRQVTSTSANHPKEEMIRARTFVLTADRIQSLKLHISEQGGGGDELPTTYVAVVSLAWASVVRAKSMDHADDAYLAIVVDCRRRLRPPLGEDYFGNCVWGWGARANVGELCGEGGVARAAAAIQECIRNVVAQEDPVGGMPEAMRGMELMPEAIRRDRMTTVGSSHRFMAYETDFGWGAPSRVELLSYTMPEMVVLHGARERGAVQVTVALNKPFMEAFATSFLDNN